MSYQTGLFEKSLQDLRNEVQEESFKELTRMSISGNTQGMHIINWLLYKLDNEYGTEYQRTKSILDEMKEEEHHETTHTEK